MRGPDPGASFSFEGNRGPSPPPLKEKRKKKKKEKREKKEKKEGNRQITTYKVLFFSNFSIVRWHWKMKKTFASPKKKLKWRPCPDPLIPFVATPLQTRVFVYTECWFIPAWLLLLLLRKTDCIKCWGGCLWSNYVDVRAADPLH